MTATLGSILRQDGSIGTQSQLRNGISREVHLVAKNLPFIMEVSFPLAMNRCKFSATLLYDNELEMDFKPVDRVRQEPMSSKVYVSEMGDRATVECRIGVLTSQHEESLFRVKVVATLTSNPDVSMELISNPIWTVSKSSQGTKVLQKKKSLPVSNVNVVAPVAAVAIPSMNFQPLSLAGTKRNSGGDPVLEALERLEKKQEEQQKMISRFFGNGGSLGVPNEEVNLEDAFTKFMTAFQKVPVEERSSKMRKLSEAHSEQFVGFIDLCASVSTDYYLPYIPTQVEPSLVPDGCYSTSSCSETCSHKKELASLESFYDQFVLSPDSSPEIV